MRVLGKYYLCDTVIIYVFLIFFQCLSSFISLLCNICFSFFVAFRREKSALASRLKAQFKALGINPSPPPSASAAPVLFKVWA